MGNFEPWPLSDLDVLGFLRRRRVLSADWAGAEQAAAAAMIASFTSSPFIEQTLIAVPLEKSMGVACGPLRLGVYGIGGEGTGGTPQISVAQGNCARFQVGIRVSLPWFDAV